MLADSSLPDEEDGVPNHIPDGDLPIQASAVPCEHVFSSSVETDTKKCNCISPRLMEVLQMVKFHLKKDRLNFTHGWVTS
jgi:hypothetical protein